MPDYRAYILNVDGHSFVRAGFLSNHPDDAVAIAAAKKLTDKHDVEVWDRGRLVARLSPGGELLSAKLAPSLIFSPPADSDKSSVRPAEPISLRKVSEFALANSSESILSL